MNYSNGFDIDQVLPALQQRLGWMQPTLAGSPTLSQDNITSKSSRFFNDGSFHALCTIENIKATQEDPAISEEDFNTYLFKLQSALIMRSLNEVFRKPELIEQVLLYTRYGWNDIAVANAGQWIGWMINVGNDQSISTQLSFATLYFDTDVDFNLYLFQDGVREPLKTIPVIVSAFAHTEVDLNLVLPFKTGSKYYLVYDQSELGDAKAIREQVETYAMTRCFEAIMFQAAAIDDGTFFNHNQKQYPGLPQGINLEVVTFRDHTQRILRKANLFDEVQGLQMAVMAIEGINNSNRANLTQRNAEQHSQQMYADLNQAYATKEVPISPGLKSRVYSEFKRLRETFFPKDVPISSDMSQNCGGLDAYEQQWAKINWNTMNNPGMLVTTE